MRWRYRPLTTGCMSFLILAAYPGVVNSRPRPRNMHAVSMCAMTVVETNLYFFLNVSYGPDLPRAVINSQREGATNEEHEEITVQAKFCK